MTVLLSTDVVEAMGDAVTDSENVLEAWEVLKLLVDWRIHGFDTLAGLRSTGRALVLEVRRANSDNEEGSSEFESEYWILEPNGTGAASSSGEGGDATGARGRTPFADLPIGALILTVVEDGDSFAPCVPLSAWCPSRVVVFLSAGRAEVDFVACTARICRAFPYVFVNTYGIQPHIRRGLAISFTPSPEQLRAAVEELSRLPMGGLRIFGGSSGYRAAVKAFGRGRVTQVIYPCQWLLGAKGLLHMRRFLRAAGCFDRPQFRAALEMARAEKLARSNASSRALWKQIKADPSRYEEVIATKRAFWETVRSDPEKYAAFVEERKAVWSNIRSSPSRFAEYRAKRREIWRAVKADGDKYSRYLAARKRAWMQVRNDPTEYARYTEKRREVWKQIKKSDKTMEGFRRRCSDMC